MLEDYPLSDIPAFPVEAGHTMMFARAIGDPNPIYFDAEYARQTPLGSIIAPPTFVEASIHYDRNFPFRPRPGRPWLGSAATPSGLPPQAEGGTDVHASTHFTYHGLLRPGMVLTTRHRSGRVWEKDGRRSGRLKFFENHLDFLANDGQVMVTSTTVGVSTERKIEQIKEVIDDAELVTNIPLDLPGSYPVPVLKASELAIGKEHAAIVASNLTRAQIIQYAGAAGDFSPQHVDEIYNTQVAGYPSVFAHGMLTMAMTGRMLTDWLGDGRLLSYGFEFRAQVWPGDTLCAKAIITAIQPAVNGAKVELAITTSNMRGVVVGQGNAHALLP